jgi:hypothetical protein
MARHALHCPGCNAVIGWRRPHGSIRPVAAVEPDREGAWLICGDCGERLRVIGVELMLWPSRKTA